MTLVAEPPAPVTEDRGAGAGPLLAELIRKGCRYSPIQAFNRLFGDRVAYFFGESSSCVMGALYEGLMGTQAIREPVVDVVKERTGVDLAAVRLPHPLYPHDPTRWTLNEVLVDLNDRRGWRREEIADWLEKALP